VPELTRLIDGSARRRRSARQARPSGQAAQHGERGHSHLNCMERISTACLSSRLPCSCRAAGVRSTRRRRPERFRAARSGSRSIFVMRP
jgi:hypothetical protein